MRVGVQWSLDVPTDWQWVEVTKRRPRWASLPKKPLPRGAAVDDQPGWVCALLCQGIVMRGFDHYAVEPVADPEWGEGLRFTLWQDGPDFTDGERSAVVWELFDPAPDAAIGGRVNTRQQVCVYAEPDSDVLIPDRRPWSDFTPPPEAVTRHGAWMSADLFLAHHNAAPWRGWREWIR